MKKHFKILLPLLLTLLISLSSCGELSYDSQILTDFSEKETPNESTVSAEAELSGDGSGSAVVDPSALTGGGETITLDSLPAYDSSAYVAVNNNIPYFDEADKQRTDAFESYSELDELGRCGTAYANICPELMPTEERGEIGQVKPSGWQTVRYDIVEGKYLYNRCHLIGFQLAGENANEKNLITGTRYLNIQGMLPFENLVADYVKETGNHVLYRVTPIFEEENLVASGVLMEGWSVEDDGESVSFCVYAYNVQPGIEIDYANGNSYLAETSSDSEEDTLNENTYVLNLSSRKFHKPDCSGVDTISEQNRKDYTGTRESLIEDGFEPCGRCKP